VAEDITARKAIETECADSRQALRRLAARLDAVREEERTNAARDLHDELAQVLTALGMDLELLRDRESGGGRSAPEDWARVFGLLEQLKTSVIDIVRRLRPPILDDLGLWDAVAALVEEHRKPGAPVLELELGGAPPPPQRERDTAIYRILQEALTNVIRHAQATRVLIQLEAKGGLLALVVRDDGRGITEEEVAQGLGCVGMRERALALGGELRFLRAPEGGAEIRLELTLA
jgi:signal transduction histidine kinase